MTALGALLLGLAGSVHCVAMCGGIVAASQAPRPRARALPQLPARGRTAVALAQNGGRLLSYTAAGMLAGALGHVADQAFATNARLALEGLAVLVLLSTGLSLLGLVPAAWTVERLGGPLWKRLAPRARALLPLDTPPRAFGFGVLWGFLPCGLVYSALALAATTQSAAGGALTMLAFGLGTLPMLLGLSVLASNLSALVRAPTVRRLAGVGLLGLGVLQATMVVRAAKAPHSCCDTDAGEHAPGADG